MVRTSALSLDLRVALADLTYPENAARSVIPSEVYDLRLCLGREDFIMEGYGGFRKGQHIGLQQERHLLTFGLERGQGKVPWYRSIAGVCRGVVDSGNGFSAIREVLLRAMLSTMTEDERKKEYFCSRLRAEFVDRSCDTAHELTECPEVAIIPHESGLELYVRSDPGVQFLNLPWS
ncbi:hypothetical protein EI94DRAFT_1703638 [Lactarius quietus]|nr:hypothetical protein EI94DRAFT_1703638 [Lactarius quietus]